MKIKYYVVHTEDAERYGLTDKELAVYSIIKGFSQDGVSAYDGGQEELSKAARCSRPTINRVIAGLIDKGLVKAEKDVFMNTRYRAIIIVSQNDTSVSQNDTRLVSQNDTHKNKDIYINNPPPPNSAYERLSKWVLESPLKEIAELVISKSKCERTLDDLMHDFYDNDFRVQERVERNERTEVLAHFQSWLRKNTRNNDNNGNKNTSANAGSTLQKSVRTL